MTEWTSAQTIRMGKPIRKLQPRKTTFAMQHRSPPSPSSTDGILCGQPTDDIILVDITSSLSSPSFFRRKYTAPILTQPFAVSEPKSGVPFDQGLVERHEKKKQWIHHGLEVLNSSFKACLPLKEAEDANLVAETDDAIKSIPTSSPTLDGEPDLLVFQENLSATYGIVCNLLPIVDLTIASLEQLSLVDIYGVVHGNGLSYWLTLKLSADRNYEYMIPPNSAFLLGPFTRTISLFNAFSKSCNTPGFDFILLDPPWPNRSAHRAKHQNSYKTSTFDVYDLFKFKASSHIRQNGVVAIWITNSSKWRNFVIGKLFPAWNVQMVAEWIWLKVTTNGEPIFDLENVARKPYESLILAKPVFSLDQSIPSTDGIHQLKDKLVFATPDIHSRKPCLKGLIEPYLSSNPRCCEIFARNLTEGWFSWGNDVLKGNWRGCWS
ncbi:hypothetical protein TWF694_002308 [Orbilia ellipsospora]|uniref:MT-A70-domain-containing protein n=1 Tax=Orbilia ellipsospora TaxID=2528407 RepID=A0AAV9X2T2_9PEZI